MRILLVGLMALPLASAIDSGSIDAIGNGELTRKDLPGLVIVTVQDGQVTYAKGFGVANVETKEPLTPQHLFRVGSTTKMFTSAAVLRLVEQGKLSLRDPVEKYVRDIHPALAKLTPHQLLSHSAGLMDRTLMFGAHDDTALAANVRALQPDVLFTKPGEVYSYSNLGYAIAGRLIEVITMQPFATAMEGLLFQPLGMTRTTFRPTMAMTYPLAQGHVREGSAVSIGRPAADHSGYWPAGSMFTNGEDFAKWAVAVMDRRVLPASVIQALTTPQVAVPNGGHYGYGVSIRAIHGVNVYSHGGSRQGYTSHFIWAPDKRAGVVTLVNVSGGDAASAAEKAFALMTGLEASATKNAPARLSLVKLAGVYTQYTNVVVFRLEGSQLVMQNEGRSTVLQPTSGNCFGTVCFTVTEEGRGKYAHVGSRAFARRD
ncbi:MAG TPA: serine hydrolase domain-containing protein [Bryobacteraceae bacterium]|nr:serine hydrolase domain-containing protein [Bryobacteraceae bacterium]